MGHTYRQDEVVTYTGAGASTGGIQPTLFGTLPSARTFATGGRGAMNTADGNNSTPVVTELYVAEVFVPVSSTITGIAVFNGSDCTDNLKAGLYDASGTLLRGTATTAGGTADTYQRIAFATDGAGAAATTISLVGPATYYIATCYVGTTSRFNTFAVGNFGAGKITSLVYATNFAAAGTALTITPPTTFTTALGPIASLY